MKVSVKLHAMLRDLIPGGSGEIEVEEGASIDALCDVLGIDPEMRELVTRNGVQADLATPLEDGDRVEIFPAVAGGSRSAYLDEGIRLFNEGDYFLAHETLEEHWIEAPDEERDFYQGLIHLAVGFHHHVRGNSTGATSQWRKSLRRLSSYPDSYQGVDVKRIREFLNSGSSVEPFEL